MDKAQKLHINMLPKQLGEAPVRKTSFSVAAGMALSATLISLLALSPGMARSQDSVNKDEKKPVAASVADKITACKTTVAPPQISMALPSKTEAIAKDDKTTMGKNEKPIILAQNQIPKDTLKLAQNAKARTMSYEQGKADMELVFDNSKYDPITFADIKELEKQTELLNFDPLPGKAGIRSTTDDKTYDHYYFENVQVKLGNGREVNGYVLDGIFEQKPVSAIVLFVKGLGRHGVVLPISILANDYKEKTGKQYAYTRVLCEKGQSNNGEYVNIFFIPVDDYRGRVNVNEGTPVLGFTYYTADSSKFYGGFYRVTR